MPKINVVKPGDDHSPSNQVVKDALREFSVTDSAGRVIGLRKPSVLMQYRLVDMVGGETAKNEVYMAMILPVVFVSSIDGDPVPPPSNRIQLEALIQRLDEHGLAAVNEEIESRFGKTSTIEEQNEKIKK